MSRVTPVRWLLVACLVLVVALPASAQGTRLLRDPAVSATNVAFVYANDLWVVGRGGGDARRLTSHPGSEGDPRFSPDGTTIAFTGQYDGNTDVYVIPVEGGEPRRLTHHPYGDGARGWTPDGTRILFASGRDNLPYATSRLWTVPVEGGWPELLPMDKAEKGCFSPDGSYVAYVPWGEPTTTWRGYRGGQTTPIWLISLSDLSVQEIPRDNSNDEDPMWIGDTIYFISDRNGTMNLFSYRPGGEVRQLTDHVDYDVKRASACDDAIVYEQAGYLHLYDIATGESHQLDIEARVDVSYIRPRIANVSSMIRDGAISPKGARAVFEARGDIFTVPAEKGDWRNISRTSGTHDRSPRWSPDGKSIAWFSDKSGEYELMIGEQTGLEPTRVIPLPEPSFFDSPLWSSDSKMIAYRDCHLRLWYVNVESGDATMVADRVVDSRVSWSSDSKWLTYSRFLPNQFQAVQIYSLDQKQATQITDGMSDAVSPVFDRGGHYIYFLASVNTGPHTEIMSMNSYTRPVTWSPYMVLLRSDDPSPFLPESDEEKIEEEKPKEEPAKPEGDGEKPKDDTKPAEEPAGDQPQPADGAKPADETKPAEVAQGEAPKEEKKEEDKSVRVDLEGIGGRILALPMGADEYGTLVTAGDPDGVLVHGPGAKLQRFDLKKRKAETLFDSIDGFDVSADGKKLLYVSGSTWGIVGAGAPSSVGQGKISTDGLQMTVDPPAEWEQIYREVWRIKRDYLYDPEMHGENWPAMYDKYHPFLASVVHRSDLNYVLELLSGELVIGHSYGGGGDLPSVPGVSCGLLGADYSVENGRYRIKRIYTGESWNPDLRAPLAAPGVKVHEGDYILSVNGADVVPPAELYTFFEGTAGRQTVLRVNGEPTEDASWLITVVPTGSEWSLRAKAWVEGNRRKVDELSGGRLAYVWLPDTTWGGYNYFVRYFFAQQDRDGAVVDERYNGGGHNADYILDSLSRPLDGAYASRDLPPQTAPAQGIFGPKVMITNQFAGSGGDALPYMFRKRGIGPLIGKRTWGGLVGISGYPVLIDGGSITAPSFAFFDTDGKWAIENEGVAPDIDIENMPADAAAGRDAQLERAVAEAMKLLEAHPPTRLERPAPINRVKWKYTQNPG